MPDIDFGGDTTIEEVGRKLAQIRDVYMAATIEYDCDIELNLVPNAEHERTIRITGIDPIACTKHMWDEGLLEGFDRVILTFGEPRRKLEEPQWIDFSTYMPCPNCSQTPFETDDWRTITIRSEGYTYVQQQHKCPGQRTPE